MRNIKNTGLYIVSAILSMAGVVSCADDIKIPEKDQSKYDRIDTVYGFVQNAVSPAERLVDLFSEEEQRAVTVGITNTLDKIVNFQLAVSEQALEEYNSANGFSYEMLPASLVSLEAASAAIAPGYKYSESISVNITPSSGLTEGTTYVVPIRITPDASEVELTDDQKDYFFFVTAQGQRENPAKKAGFKIISCMETGDADPRIHLEFRLENEGKLFTDMVILFSANLNYDQSSGKVYVHMNNSITPILNNRDKYLKPLQDKGIKVLLGIMGNWDPSGVGYMENHVNEQFVRELKTVIDTYKLDGVFWDDEYTSANSSIPGFTSGSYDDAMHLVYTAKKMMPDKINIVYQYNNTGHRTGNALMPSVNGLHPGEFIDYVLADYGYNIYLNQYPALTKSQGMPYPAELTGRNQGDPGYVREGHWGGMMIFALSEHRSNWQSYGLPAMKNIANKLFDDNLVYTGVSYPVEW